MWGRDFRVTLLKFPLPRQPSWNPWNNFMSHIKMRSWTRSRTTNTPMFQVPTWDLRSGIVNGKPPEHSPRPRQQLLTAPARFLNRDSSHWGLRRNPTSHPRGYAYLRISFFTSRSSSSWSFWMKLLRTGISNFIYWATWGEKSKSGVQDPSQHYSNFFWHLSHIRHKALGNLFLH